LSAAQKCLYGEFMSPACPVFFAIFLTKFGVPRKIFVGVPNIKLYENPLSGCRSEEGGRTVCQTDMTKGVGALRENEYASVPQQCLEVLE